MTDGPVLLTERRGAVAVLTMNRPDVGNAMNGELRDSMLEAFRALQLDADVRCVVLAGAGKHFSTGVDLSGEEELTPAAFRVNSHRYDVILELARIPVPVIAAVEGFAAGSGMALALACDVRVIAEDGTLFPAFTQRGLAPDSGVAWFLARTVGPGQAMQWLLDATRIPAAEAMAARLVQHVAEPGQALARALEVAERWAAGPTVAYAMAKRQVRQAMEYGLADALEFEQDSRFLLNTTHDRGEGRHAFQEKRPPQFSGR